MRNRLGFKRPLNFQPALLRLTYLTDEVLFYTPPSTETRIAYLTDEVLFYTPPGPAARITYLTNEVLFYAAPGPAARITYLTNEALLYKPTVPSAPTGVTATPENGGASVVWSPAISSGVAPASYELQYSADGGTTWTTFSSSITATAATVTGLTNNTAYVFRVRASNSVGTGPWSANSNSVTPTAS